MKKITVLLIALIVSFQLFSQEVQPIEHKPIKTDLEFKPIKTDYLAKSKKQRTVGWILTGPGIAMTSIGLVMAMKNFGEGFGYAMSMSAGEPPTHSDVDAVLFLTGTVMLCTGIVVLSIARYNKKKALSISFINESSKQLRFNTVMYTSVPSVCLRFQL